jgi:hypothetical protein
MIVRSIIEKLFKRRGAGRGDARRLHHLHIHAHVAEVYKCRCGHTEVRERR